MEDTLRYVSVEETGATPDADRNGVALCLSGGGFRATLFHLGALRRLNALGVLSQVRTISAVSGGSITSAALAASMVDGTVTWPAAGESIAPGAWSTFEQRVRTFVSYNVRSKAFFGTPGGAVERLADVYRSALLPISFEHVAGLPVAFVWSATDLKTGTNWEFRSAGTMGDYQLGYAPIPAAWPVATAVAASSCFPPVFDAMDLELDPADFTGGAYDGADRDEFFDPVRLSDGGVYDNLGLEPVWKGHAGLLVSDGGAPFALPSQINWLARFRRYVSVATRQASAVRKRWLIAGYKTGVYDGTYWGIGTNYTAYEGNGVVPVGFDEPATRRLSRIRTDLDGFSGIEADYLGRHGESLTDAAIRRWAGAMIGNPNAPTLAMPDSDDAYALLADSGRRTIMGRGSRKVPAL